MWRFKLSTLTRHSICLLLIFVLHVSNGEQQPDIFVVLTEALGWGDVSFHGISQIPTPNLDTLARTGVPLKQLYTQPSSSAARGCFFSGKYAHRIGLQDMFLVPGVPVGLPAQHKLLPEYLQELGYETHLVGKWHLGYHSHEMLPTARGFDSFYGSYLDHMDYYNLTYEEDFWTNASAGFDFHLNEKPLKKAQGHYVTSLLDARVSYLVQRRSSKPMFVVLSHVAPGGTEDEMSVKEVDEYAPEIRHIVSKRRARFAAVVETLDASVAQLIKGLENAGILNNSILLFMSATGGRSTSDQLAPVASSPWPLRGQRFSYFEGGIRSTAVLWSPLLNDKGYASEKMYHMSDWLPTFVKLAGGSINSLKDVDGLDIWPSLSYEEIPSPRSRIIHTLNHYQKMFVARVGRYKVISGNDSLSVHNDWYPAEGGEVGDEHVDHLMQNSLVYETLSKYEDFLNIRTGWRRDISLHCDKEDFPNAEECHPETAACLFDIQTDPCEYDNLAKFHPERVQAIQTWVQSHSNEEASPVLTFRHLDHFDPKADPRVHDGNWEPWIAED